MAAQTLSVALTAVKTALAGLCDKPPAELLTYLFAALGALSIATYMLPWLLTFLAFRSQNFKRRYANCNWAVVTGGSSGIGLSLCRKLAAQGINIVMIAVPDALLAKSAKELAEQFPAVEVRAVGADLGKEASTYLPALADATKDIDVTLVFNNAGYIVTGFFAETPLEKWLANAQCNAMAAIAITHLFVGRMRAAGLKGAVCFTSSPANIIPSPFSTLYGATKSMVTHFASSLACELGPEGIDVCVIHPSPVATRFYTGTHALPTLKLFQSTATGPDRVADVLLAGIGRTVVVDQGYYPPMLRVLLRVLDLSLLTDIMVMLAGSIQDYKALKTMQGVENKAAAAAVASKAAEPAAPVSGASSSRSRSSSVVASNKGKKGK